MSLCKNCHKFVPEFVSPEDNSNSNWALERRYEAYYTWKTTGDTTVHPSWASFATSLNGDCPICWTIWRCIRPSPTTAIYGEECLGFEVRVGWINLTPNDGWYEASAVVDIPPDLGFRLDKGPITLAIGESDLVSRNFSFRIYKTDEETFMEYENTRTVTSEQTASTVASMARGWISECDKEHLNCAARSLPPSYASMPKRLLDVGSNKEKVWRVIEPQRRVSYAALSHRWTSSTPRLLAENRDTYYDWQSDSLLPQSYQDIFDICRMLPFQYVWIDSLCILQDDGGNEFRREAPIMKDIYRHASLTLTICWDSPGATILRKCRPRSIPRPLPLEIYSENLLSTVTTRDYVFVSFDKDFLNDVTTSPINHRAWVLQERYLSRRILYLGNDQLYWECDELASREREEHYITKDIFLEPDGVPGQRESIFASPVRLMDKGWSNIIDTYTDCALTFESDRFVAIAGLAKAISEKTKNTYMAGIWLEYWMKDIIWTPRRGRLPNLYKKASDETKDTAQGKTKISAPSWSWLDFDGAVNTQPWSVWVGLGREDFLTSKLNSFESTEMVLAPLATLVGYRLTPSGCDPFAFFDSAVLEIKGLLLPLDIKDISQIQPFQKQSITLELGDERLRKPKLDLQMSRYVDPSLCCFMIPLFLCKISIRETFHSSIAYGLVVQERSSGDNRRFVRVGIWEESFFNHPHLSPMLCNTIVRTVTKGAKTNLEQTASQFEAKLSNFATDQISTPVDISYERLDPVECSSLPSFTNAEWATIPLY